MRYITDFVPEPARGIHIAWYPEEKKYYASHWDLLFDFISDTDLELLAAQAKFRWPNLPLIFHMGHEFYF